MIRAAALTVLFALAAAPGCAARSTVVGRTAGGAEIVMIPLSISNAYLVKTKTPVLVDSGSDGDMEDLEAALAEHGVAVRDIRLVVLTHGHADHAGLAADIRRLANAQVALGEGDLGLARRGHNDEMRPTGLFARLLRLFLAKDYPDFVPSIVVGKDPLDLAPWGIEGKAVQMPGHTDGSAVVLLSNKAAFVGDEILGGWFGGALFPRDPGEHYFQQDDARNRANIEQLVKQGVETFYLGHGGPVARADVMDEFGIR